MRVQCSAPATALSVQLLLHVHYSKSARSVRTGYVFFGILVYVLWYSSMIDMTVTIFLVDFLLPLCISWSYLYLSLPGLGAKLILLQPVCGYTVAILCILGYPNLNSKLPKSCNLHEFHYNLQDGGHLVMWSVFQPPVCYLNVFFTLTVLMLVLMLEVQKGCNGVVDTCI